MNKLFEQSILRTLTYFNIVKKTLTADELFCFLWQPPFGARAEFDKCLSENAGGRWQTKDGLYFLPGRDELVEKRIAGRGHSDRLLKIAVHAVKKIRSVPFVHAVFVCNSVGSMMANENSDVDLFIITAPKRVWLVRFFSNIAMLISGMRRRGNKIAGKICLSFLVDEKNLNLAPWRVCDDDIHFAYWLYQMIPVYDPDNLYDKMLSANSWTKKYLPNVAMLCHPRASGDPVATSINRPLDSRLRGDDKLDDSKFGLKWKKMWEKFWSGAYGDLIENQARGAQQAKIKFSSHGKVRPHDKSVIVGDGVIKLHEGDTRLAIHQRWLDALLKWE